MKRETIFSDCGKYRYTLWREWQPSPDFWDGTNDGERGRDSYVNFIGLNPSTADATKDDPTIRRCIGFAKSWGFTALCMTNLFAWRETDSRLLKKVQNPMGEHNHHHLLDISSKAQIVVAAWGTKGVLLNGDLQVKEWLGKIGIKFHCIRKTEDGHPEHPLYLPGDLAPTPL